MTPDERIAELEAALAALRQSKDVFQTAFHASPAALAIATIPDGRIVEANASVVELVGRPREQLVGATAVGLGLWPDPEHRIKLVSAMSARGEVRDFPAHLRRGSGEVRDVLLSTEVIAVGGRPSLLVAITDVTRVLVAERLLEEAQRRLERSEARYRHLVEASAQGVLALSPDRRVTFASGRMAAMLGTTPEALVGRPLAELVDAPPGLEDEMRRRREAGYADRFDLTLVRADGGRTVVEVTATPLLDPQGRYEGALALLSDVTQRRQAEEVRARLERSLRDTEERLHHLQRMEAIGALAGGIAHDFNNLLSVILGSATLIDDTAHDPQAVREDLRAIRDAAERASAMTRQLLAFSRRQVLEPQVTRLDPIIAGLEPVLHRLIGERIRLATRLASRHDVLIDPAQFEQVVMNLVVNARDAMPEGGDLVIASDSVELSEADASGLGASPGAYACVAVSDTGTGMDEATRARAFEPFFTTKPKGKGTGLGLATVFGIVRQSGGFVRLASEPGRGTTVEVGVPRTARRAQKSDRIPMPVSTKGNGEVVLLVEDEEPVRRLVAKLLHRHGYDVLAAANAGEALLLAEQERPIDVLLTDVVMPVMDGRQLAARLRAARPKLPVIYMSGYHEDDVLSDLVASADVAYLEKPIRRDALVRKLREVLDASTAPAPSSPV